MDITQFSTFCCDEYSCASEGAPFGSFSQSLRRKSHIPYNRLFHHRRLFSPSEEFSIAHKTDGAILFEDENGLFWVPKALIQLEKDCIYVHKSFQRSYIERNE